MSSFNPNSRGMESTFLSSHAPYRSQVRSTNMPPPPPPPLFSRPLKRFDSRDSVQVNRSGTGYLEKFSSQQQFVTPTLTTSQLVGHEVYGRREDAYGRYSSSLPNRSRPQNFLQPRHYGKPEVNRDFNASERRKYQQYDSASNKFEEETDRPVCKTLVEDQRGINCDESDFDSVSVKTSRKRHAERDLDEADAVNAGLPKELTKKFGPLKCDLCGVEVNSTLQARMHYSGKQHEKRVKSFLQTWVADTGESLPKQFISGQAQKQSPESSYCDVCNIVLTSAAHAMQHKLGSKHKRNVANRAFKNAENEEEESYPADDPTGRFGIGLAFHPRDNPDVLGLMSEESDSASKSKKLFCELCQVAATCRDQMIMHLKGARHRKAENARRLKISSGDLDSENDESSQPSELDKDYSIYRTPTGYYYCQPCNVTVNSEAQFIQHCQSKKHTKKSQQ